MTIHQKGTKALRKKKCLRSNTPQRHKGTKEEGMPQQEVLRSNIIISTYIEKLKKR
ncbi:MAG: hypothetical protein ACRCT1_17450 [Microcoleaceae cyanobacterium]